MLQSKAWGWIQPLQSPEIGGVPIAPLGISLTTWLILAGCALIAWFFRRQRRLIDAGRPPFLDVTLFRIDRLRSGLGARGPVRDHAGLFFMIPVYLQMTLGFDALQTGPAIFPLRSRSSCSRSLGTRLSQLWSPRRIVRVGQVAARAVGGRAARVGRRRAAEPRVRHRHVRRRAPPSACSPRSSATSTCRASDVEKSSEVGGLQGVFQNLGSSLGTALIGSVLIGALATSFAGTVATSDLPDDVKQSVAEATEGGRRSCPRRPSTRSARRPGSPRTTRTRSPTRLQRVADRVAAHRVRRAHRDRAGGAAVLPRHPGGRTAAPTMNGGCARPT